MGDISNTEYSSISYSQFSVFSNCSLRWFKQYITKEAKSPPTLSLTFGTAIHETIQHYLTVLYTESTKSANNIDVEKYFEETFLSLYQKEKEVWGSYTTRGEFYDFLEDGKGILKEFLKRRTEFFSSRKFKLVGVEIPILQKINRSKYYKGFIDLVLYDEARNKYIIFDLKTSKSGWKDYDKKSELKKAQVLLYKHYFSIQFDVPVDDIEVLFMIFRRKPYQSDSYTVKRIQEFVPAQKKQSVSGAVMLIESFVDAVFDEDGTFNGEEQKALPSKFNCGFCQFKNNCEFAYKE